METTQDTRSPQARHMARKREERSQAGLCPTCGADPQAGRKKCARCLQSARESMGRLRKRRADSA